MAEITSTTYGFVYEVPFAFEETVAKVRQVFMAEGFGVLTEIDVQAKMKEKLGREMDKYLILGMCNPGLAARAIAADPNVGLLLPCNVVIRQAGEKIIVAAQRPSLFSLLTDNAEVNHIAQEAEERISAALRSLQES